MATKVGVPYAGPFVIDLTDLTDHLVDLPPSAMRGMRAEQDGFDEVLAELNSAVPHHGEAMDIPATVHQRIVAATPVIAKLREREAELKKALEVCTESRAKMENDREDDIGKLAGAVRDVADKRGDPSVAAPFEKTLEYNSRIARKAAETRRKNAKGKGEPAKDL